MKLVHPCAKKSVFDLVFAVNNLKRHRLDRLGRGRWFADEISLPVRHIKADQGRQLFFCFNALGNDARVGERGKFLHALDQGLSRKVFVHPTDEPHIKLGGFNLQVQHPQS